MFYVVNRFVEALSCLQTLNETCGYFDGSLSRDTKGTSSSIAYITMIVAILEIIIIIVVAIIIVIIIVLSLIQKHGCLRFSPMLMKSHWIPPTLEEHH